MGTIEALVLDVGARTGRVKDVPMPKPAPNEVLVHVRAIALNPVIQFTQLTLWEIQVTVYAQTSLERLWHLNQQSPFLSDPRAGSPVAGFLQGACSANERPGAFAECSWDFCGESTTSPLRSLRLSAFVH